MNFPRHGGLDSSAEQPEEPEQPDDPAAAQSVRGQRGGHVESVVDNQKRWGDAAGDENTTLRNSRERAPDQDTDAFNGGFSFGTSQGEIDREAREATEIPEVSSPEGLVEATLTDTFNATCEWAIVELIKHGADLLHPGLGQFIDLSQRLVEGFHDVAALEDSEGTRVLQIPLVQSASGFDIDLHIRLAGSEDSGASTPRINGFVAPSGDSLLGGWAIEKAEPSAPIASAHPTASQELRAEDVELRTTEISTDKAEESPESSQSPLSPTWRWVRRRKVGDAAIGIADLSRFSAVTEPKMRAAMLRYVARHYRDEIIACYPGDRLEVVIINDPAMAQCRLA